METYIVQEGDSLSTIAHKFYGDANRYVLIARQNGIDPNSVCVGDVLDIPLKQGFAGPMGDASYTVQAGDSLSSISQTYYGTPNNYMQIATANGIADPNSISVGQILDIPGASAPASSVPAVSAPITASSPAPASSNSNLNQQIMIIAGLAAAAAGLYWWISNKKESPEGSSNPENGDEEDVYDLNKLSRQKRVRDLELEDEEDASKVTDAHSGLRRIKRMKDEEFDDVDFELEDE